MYNSVCSAAIRGMEVVPIRIEADVSDGLPHFTMVGDLTAQVREAEDRVKTALKNVGIALPPKRITINLAPADLPKSGCRFDLPIALVILAAVGLLPEHALSGVMAVGELGLDGSISRVTGVLPIAMRAREEKIRLLLVPAENEAEARILTGLVTVGVSTLPDAIALLRSGELPEDSGQPTPLSGLNEYREDFADIRGQEAAKRAAMIAVSGFHNLLLIGPPGSGKTMLARRIPSILPELTAEESLEISQIYSIAGLLPPDRPFLGTRPFRSPHHTVSPQALAGGGKIPSPGEITLAHRGILFLDEMPEFERRSLEILRQPLEDREITLSRAAGTFRFPAHFLLLAAMNPCPCGYYPDMNRCTCLSSDIARYIGKISKPLLDRIDLCVESAEVSYEDLTERDVSAPSSASIRSRVEAVHAIEKERFAGTSIRFNSEIPASAVSSYCPMDSQAEILLARAFSAMKLSARGYHRIIRVARTIADLDGSRQIRAPHISEAICYRTIDRKYWS